MAGMFSARGVCVSPQFVRAFSSSFARNARFRSGAPAAPLKEIGRFTEPKKDTDGPYVPGQLFLHKLFAYRGIVICSFNCRVIEKPRVSQSNTVAKMETSNFYQVLIHRGDWQYMHFPVDITSYLSDAGSRGEKSLSVIHGMDCVAHDEILPFTSCDTKAMDHDLFERIFDVTAQSADTKDVEFVLRKDLMQNYLSNQRSWLSPQEVYRETTDGIQVTVITFYLGSNIVGGQQKHCWRYVMRLENLEDSTVVLRERSMKVFSLNNMQQVTANSIVGTNPRLSPQEPAFQFSSTIDLPQPKGAHMWGRFKMERENGTSFEVTMPTITLESHPENLPQQTETQL